MGAEPPGSALRLKEISNYHQSYMEQTLETKVFNQDIYAQIEALHEQMEQLNLATELRLM